MTDAREIEDEKIVGRDVTTILRVTNGQDLTRVC